MSDWNSWKEKCWPIFRSLKFQEEGEIPCFYAEYMNTFDTDLTDYFESSGTETCDASEKGALYFKRNSVEDTNEWIPLKIL